MRTPDAPFLELGFYFRQKSGREALRHVAETLTNHFAAVPTDAYTSAQATPSLFRTNEVVGRPVKIQSADDLERLMRDPYRFVRKISFDGGTRVVRDAQEFLVVLPIEESDCKSEGNVVAIWIEGAAFSRGLNTEISKKEKQVAARALTAFKKLVSLLLPTYASITVDYGLENPCDLQRDSRSLAFRDFYLGRRDFGEKFLEELRSRFPNSDYDDHDGGQITTTTAAFRLAAGHESFGDNGYELSQFVGRSIGKMLT
jgi:hypothetical protein